MSRITTDVERLQQYNPYNTIEEEELDDVIGNFVTLIWIIKDKKLTKTTFFIEILENDVMRNIFKTICGCDTDVELYKEILIRYPSVSESKFIRTRINKRLE